MAKIEEDPNTIIYIKGCLVYSVTIVAIPVMGLATKFVIPIARPLISIGKSCWLIWYPKLWMLVTCSLTNKIMIGISRLFLLTYPDS